MARQKREPLWAERRQRAVEAGSSPQVQRSVWLSVSRTRHSRSTSTSYSRRARQPRPAWRRARTRETGDGPAAESPRFVVFLSQARSQFTGDMSYRRPLLAPSSWLLALGSWLLALGSWLLALGSWLLALGSWLLALGSWLLALGSWLLALGSWLLALGSWLLALGSWLLALGSWQENLHRARSKGPPPSRRPFGHRVSDCGGCDPAVIQLRASRRSGSAGS